MTDDVRRMQDNEMSKVGMAFMGFLMGIGSILGVWFLTGLIQVISKMMG